MHAHKHIGSSVSGKAFDASMYFSRYDVYTHALSQPKNLCFLHRSCSESARVQADVVTYSCAGKL